MTVFDNMQEKIAEVKSSEFFKPYIDEMKKRFEENVKNEIPLLTYKDFMCFYETGSRKEYESKYFARRERLGYAFVLYLLFEKEEYMDEISNCIWAICSEVTWVSPAHLGHVPVDGYSTDIDLFAAETALYLAEIYYFLSDKLPERIRELIVNMLKLRTFDAFENQTYWWETLKSNWAAVCGGSVAMAYMYANPRGFEKVSDRLVATLHSYLSGYGDDGCCPEGVSYWDYGFEFFIYASDLLKRFTDGKINLMSSPKITAMAQCLQKMIMRKDITVSFSDGARKGNFYNIGLYSYIKSNFDGIQVPENIGASLTIRSSNPALVLRMFMWTNPSHFSDSGIEFKSGMEYFPDTKWYINRQNKFSFAAKAGHNNEEHNHNDLGSFIICTDSGQLLCDIGAMIYTKDNFDPQKRYSIFHNASYGHSVPIIDGKDQSYGEKYFADVLEVTDTAFKMNLHNAYETDVKKIVRSFEVEENTVVLTDTFDSASGHKITERFVSAVEPFPAEGGVKIDNLFIKTDKTAKIGSEKILNHSLQEEEFYTIDFDVDCSEFKIEFVIM